MALDLTALKADLEAVVAKVDEALASEVTEVPVVDSAPAPEVPATVEGADVPVEAAPEAPAETPAA